MIKEEEMGETAWAALLLLPSSQARTAKDRITLANACLAFYCHEPFDFKSTVDSICHSYVECHTDVERKKHFLV